MTEEKLTPTDQLVDLVNGDLKEVTKENSTMRTITISVVSSIVAMLLVSMLIKPAFEAAWPWLKSSSSEHISEIIDGYIKNASLGDRNWVTAYFGISYYLFVMGLSFFLLLLVTSKYRGLNTGKRKQVEKKSLGSMYRKIKVQIILLWLVVPVIFYFQLLGAGRIYYDIQLNASFSQRMKALAPAVNEQEEEEFFAAWATMETKNDFDSINSQMEKLAAERKIKLPKLLLK